MLRYRVLGSKEEGWCVSPLRDLSVGGAHFLSEHAFNVGVELETQLLLPFSQEPLSLVSRVAWVRPWHLKVVEIGVTFSSSDTGTRRRIEEAVAYLVQREEATPLQKKERRKFPRVPRLFEARYRSFGDPTAPWMALTTLNLGIGGMRVRCPRTYESGTVLELQMSLPGVTEALVLRGCVVWTRMQSPGVVELGLAFLGLAQDQQARVERLVQVLRRSSL
jgi:Tfp pilus assembly protein PilZ